MKEIVSSVAAGPAKPAYQAQPLGGAKPQPAERQDVVSANALPVTGQAQSQPVTEEAPLLPEEQEKVEKAVEDINDHFQSMGRDLSFAVDEDSGRTIITVFDSETQEVVRQIPPEEVLDLAMNLVDAGGVASTGLAEKV
jgi:flagellar protein FlaG